MKKMITNIVFTKNRPLQLEGYLESLYRYLPAKLIQTYILYKPELFEEEYKKVFSKYSDCIIIEENNFYRDFLKIINQVNTQFTLFGIDDVVYFDTVGFEIINETFNMASDDIFGFTLRFGTNGTDTSQDPISQTIAAGQPVYSLNWTKGRTDKTRYPFELCATVYTTILVKKVIYSTMSSSSIAKALFSPDSVLIKALSMIISTRSILKTFGYFFSPNTLESWVCRWCQNHSDQLPSLLFLQKQCATAIQVNMVNTSAKDKEFDGGSEYTVEALAEKYRQGYRLDIDHIAKNKPSGTQSGHEYFRLIKNKQI
jgi:hypothetical protein